MSKLYIDFDGVILDTWELIFKKYYEQYNTADISEKRIKKLMLNIGWDYILNNSKEINESIKKIKRLDQKYDICILTKVNSTEEKTEKAIFLQKVGIKNMIFVPYEESKTKYAVTHNNILIDDDLKNLKEWEENGGISIYFNKNLKIFDSYGNKNNKFIIINDLSKIYDIIQ